MGNEDTFGIVRAEAIFCLANFWGKNSLHSFLLYKTLCAKYYFSSQKLKNHIRSKYYLNPQSKKIIKQEKKHLLRDAFCETFLVSVFFVGRYSDL